MPDNERIAGLKKAVCDRYPLQGLIILEWPGQGNTSFLPNQYLSKMAESWDRHIVWQDSLEQAVLCRDGLFSDHRSLYAIHMDAFDRCPYMDASKLDSIVVITPKVDSALAERFKDSLYVFPAPERWQIVAYAESLADRLSPDKAEWLCAECHYNIFRIDSEFRRIGMFGNNEQDRIFMDINSCEGYSDLTVTDAFSLLDSVTDRNAKEVYSALCGAESAGVEPVGFLTMLIKQFRLMTDMQMDPGTTPEGEGISAGRFRAVKARIGKYGVGEIAGKYHMLLDAYDKLTHGIVDAEEIIPYVVSHLMEDDR